MSVIAVICARKGSWDKNAEMVDGVPMVVRAIRAVDQVIERVLVSTDSRAVARWARSAGAIVVNRPAKLSGPTARIETAARHAVQTLRLPSEVVLVIQANMPIWWDHSPHKAEFCPEYVGNCMAMLSNLRHLTAVATAIEVGQRPEWMKIQGRDFVTRPFMPKVKSYRRQDLPPLYYLDGQVVAVRTEVLMSKPKTDKVHGWMGDKVGMVIHDQIHAIEVHDRSDIRMAEAAIAALKGGTQ